MNGSLHLRGNVVRLYLAGKEKGRGLVSCKECANVKMRSSGKYFRESEEQMLKFVARLKGLSEVEDPDAFKKLQKRIRQVSGWINRFMVDS